MRMRRGLALAVVIATGFGVLAACSDDKTETIAVEATEPGSGQFKLTAPASVGGGVVKVNFKNSGKASHDAQLVRVEGNHSRDDVLGAITGNNSSTPDWLFAEGGVGTTAPGQSRSATLKLSPGTYYALDTGTDDNNNSYAKGGAVTMMTVTNGSSGTVPQSGARIQAKDYEFTIPTLKAGTQDITFDNIGNQPHLLVAAPIAPGKTLEDVKTVLASQDQNAAPPLDFNRATTVAAIEGTKAVATSISLQKGNYAFICFLSDRGGGPPHFTLGMIQEAAVN
jgi:hypothetical protein